MTKETEMLDYVEEVSGLMMRVTDETSARAIALDLWKFYTAEAQLLSTALQQTQHMRTTPRLFLPKQDG